MGKVILTISYEIEPAARSRFLTLVQAMKNHNGAKDGIAEYSIFENKLKQNNFTEIFVFRSVEEFEKLEEEDDAAVDFTANVKSMVVGGKMKYSTLVEL